MSNAARNAGAAFALAILTIAGLESRTNAWAKEGPKPILSGRWELNRELSDDPQKKVQDMSEDPGAGDDGAGRGREGGGFGRGGIAGGMGRGDMGRGGDMGGGGDGDPEKARRQLEDGRRLLQEESATLLITHADPKVELVQADGHLRTLYTDKRKVKDGDRETRTRWDGSAVITERKLGDSVRIIESYELAPGGRQLVVTTKMSSSMMGRSRSVSVRRVYDKTADAPRLLQPAGEVCPSAPP